MGKDKLTAEQKYFRDRRYEAVGHMKALRTVVRYRAPGAGKNFRERSFEPGDFEQDIELVMWKHDHRGNPIGITTNDGLRVYPAAVISDGFIPNNGASILCFLYFPGGRDAVVAKGRDGFGYAIAVNGPRAAKDGLCLWNMPERVRAERDHRGRRTDHGASIRVRDDSIIRTLTFKKVVRAQGNRKHAEYQCFERGKRGIWIGLQPPVEDMAIDCLCYEQLNMFEAVEAPAALLEGSGKPVVDVLTKDQVQLPDGTRLDKYDVLGLTSMDDHGAIDSRVRALLDQRPAQLRKLIKAGNSPLVKAAKAAESEFDFASRQGLKHHAKLVKQAAAYVRGRAPKAGYVWLVDRAGKRLLQVPVFAGLGLEDSASIKEIEAQAAKLYKKTPKGGARKGDPLTDWINAARKEAGDDPIDFSDEVAYAARKNLIMAMRATATRMAEERDAKPVAKATKKASGKRSARKPKKAPAKQPAAKA